MSGVLLLVVLAAGPVFGQVRTTLPVPDVPGYHTLKCDFHIHTVFSDGEVWPATRVTEAWRDGLDVIAITDHAGHHPHKLDVSTDLARPYAVALAEAERLGILLVPGVEVMEGNIHFNLLFVTNPNAFPGLKMLPSLRVAASQKAFAFWNHPGWKMTPKWDGIAAQAHSEKLFRGMELVNGPVFYPEAFPFVAEHDLTILANSDVHAPMQTEYPHGGRPVTLLLARTRDLAGIREALEAGRTAAWMGGNVWGARELLEGLWEGAVEVENEQVRLVGSPGRNGLRLRNHSAIPFRLHVKKCPEWLYCSDLEIAPLSTGFLALQTTDSAPEGAHHVEIEAEITNLHTASAAVLQVKLPFTAEVN
ncbi:MAG: hypothetical protein KJZ78_19805 [Bryobacteraceae bacterium]|nr:hypothetical protein [Bryobacteraceae bacterium]